MDDHEWLATQFERHRTHLRSVAYRMLGSLSEADDAVQEAWLRLSRSNADEVQNLGGWLTTVVARVCLDMLRSRRSLAEKSLELHSLQPSTPLDTGTDPEQEALMADSVGLAMLVVLDTLEPAERIALVLHDMFAVPYDDIALIVGRSTVAARQLASRARRRVQGASTAPDVVDLEQQKQAVEAFLTASREGDFEALLALLDPDVMLRADQAAIQLSASLRDRGAPELAEEVRGSAKVANILFGRAHGAQPALVNGVVGAVWAPGRRPRGVFDFTISDGKVVQIDVIVDPERIQQFELVLLDT